jgi:hypothetical protein
MVVRIRLARGPRLGATPRKNRHVALALAALLTPSAVMATALGLWRIAADLHLTKSFAIRDGLFSHWQVWGVTAVFLQLCSRGLSHYARGKDSAAL